MFCQVLVNFVASTSTYDKGKMDELATIVQAGSVNYSKLTRWQQGDERLSFSDLVSLLALLRVQGYEKVDAQMANGLVTGI